MSALRAGVLAAAGLLTAAGITCLHVGRAIDRATEWWLG